MNILWVSASFPHPPIDGGAVRSFHLLRELSDRGHRIAVLAFGPSRVSAESMKIMQGMAEKVLCLPHPPVPPVWKRFLWKLGRVPSSVRRYRSPEMTKALNDMKAEFRPDLVVGDLIQMAPYMAALNMPRILNINDSMALTLAREAHAEESRFRAWLLRFESLRYLWFERKMASACDAMVVVSHADSRYFQSRGCTNVAVVTNGVDVGHYDRRRVRPVDAGGPALIFTGNLSHPPNVKAVRWFVREVLPRLRTQGVDPEVRLVGLSPCGEIREQAEKDPRIQLTGFVPDLRPWLAGSSVYVAPMRSGSGIKNKVLEAMAMEVPVVSTPLGVEGMPEVRPGVEVRVAEDPAGFAADIIDLLRDPKRAAEQAAAARTLVAATYSWAGRAVELEQLMQGVVLSHGRQEGLCRDKRSES